MAGSSTQKIKLLYLADILKKYTDEQHPLSAAAICEKLAEYGVSAERKSIYNDIRILQDYGMDIISTRTPSPGFFLGSRLFEMAEIYLLCDAVGSAEFISKNKSRELISKLESFMSDPQARAVRGMVHIDNLAKCDNEELFYNIDAVARAITENKKIRLTYRRRILIEGKIKYTSRELVISPYALAWENDRYYVVGNNEKYDNLMHMRLDRMRAVTVLPEKMRHFSEVSEYRDYFDTADYMSKTFNMFGGELCNIELCCESALLDQVVDRFGDGCMFRGNSENDTISFSVKARISEGLVGWILQFGGSITVKSPPKLRERLKSDAEKILKQYK